MVGISSGNRGDKEKSQKKTGGSHISLATARPFYPTRAVMMSQRTAFYLYSSVHNLMTNGEYRFGQSAERKKTSPQRTQRTQRPACKRSDFFLGPFVAANDIPGKPLARNLRVLCVFVVIVAVRSADVQRLQGLIVQFAGDRQLIY